MPPARVPNESVNINAAKRTGQYEQFFERLNNILLVVFHFRDFTVTGLPGISSQNKVDKKKSYEA